MTPRAALHNSTFLAYAVITAGILVLAAAALTLRQRHKDVRSVWLTYQSWLVMVPAIGLCILLGRWAVVGGVTLLAMLAFFELARAADVAHARLSNLAVYLLLLMAGAACVMHNPWTHQPGNLQVFLAMPAVAALVLMSVPVLLDRTHDQLRVTSTCLSSDSCRAGCSFISHGS